MTCTPKACSDVECSVCTEMSTCYFALGNYFDIVDVHVHRRRNRFLLFYLKNGFEMV